MAYNKTERRAMHNFSLFGPEYRRITMKRRKKGRKCEVEYVLEDVVVDEVVLLVSSVESPPHPRQTHKC